MSKQKDKGKYFENITVKHIRNIFHYNEFQCMRAPFSGNGELEFGDIYFSNPTEYGMLIECKFHNDWNLKMVFPVVQKKILKIFKDELVPAVLKYNKKLNKYPDLFGLAITAPYDNIYFVTPHRTNNLGFIKTKLNKEDFILKFEALYTYNFEDFLNFYYKSNTIEPSIVKV